MSASIQQFNAAHYTERAGDYVSSLVHSTGDDLRQIARTLEGRGLGSVLDLGCGGGHVSYTAAPLVGNVTACDLTPAMLDVVARTAAERGLANIAVQQAAADALPFEAARFDAVLCRFTAHHWPDLEAGLREARRVTRPGGLCLFIDVFAPVERVLDSHLQAAELLRDPSHVRNYSVSEWLSGLDRAGFRIDSVVRRKLRMEFPVWIARTRTPALAADAIRALQAAAPEVVRSHFAVDADGSFDLDVATMTGFAG